MEDSATLTEAELAQFAQKLDAWADQLSDRERQFLQQILSDAAFSASGDSSGYADLAVLDEGDVQGFDLAPEGGILATVFEYGMALDRAEQEYASLSAIAG